MDDAVVVLTWSEMMQAAMCGAMRNIAAMRDGRQPAPRVPHSAENTWTIHIEGAAGEMAFAKHAGFYWGATVNSFKLPDVGAIQVRTRSRHSYDLIIRRGDCDDDVFVLVTGIAPRFVIRGWIGAREAKSHPEWIQTHGEGEAAWFVPQAALLAWKRNAKSTARLNGAASLDEYEHGDEQRAAQ